MVVQLYHGNTMPTIQLLTSVGVPDSTLQIQYVGLNWSSHSKDSQDSALNTTETSHLIAKKPARRAPALETSLAAAEQRLTVTDPDARTTLNHTGPHRCACETRRSLVMELTLVMNLTTRDAAHS